MAKLCALRGPWFDSTGNILNAGLIYTYQTGTSTPKTTYADEGGSTPLTNPIVLEANGCKTFYIDQDTAYRFVIKTSGGTTVDTIDEVVPLSLLAAGVGATDIDVSDHALITTANKDLYITPNGSGALILDGLTWPTDAPTTNQVLVAQNATTLTWGSPSTGLLQNDSNPTLSNPLITNGYNIKSSNNTGVVDGNSNETLLFGQTASAVNYTKITNSAASSGPTIAALGDDTNITLNLQGKGTGGCTLDKGIINGTLAVTGASTLGASTLSSLTVSGNFNNNSYPTTTAATGQTLQATSSGVLGWADISSGMRYIGTSTASAVSEIVLTLTGYSHYRIVGVNISGSTGTQHLEFVVSQNGGSSYLGAGNNYSSYYTQHTAGGSFATQQYANQTKARITETITSGVTFNQFIMDIYDFSASVHPTTASNYFMGQMTYLNGGLLGTMPFSGKTLGLSNPINRIKFTLGAGNISGHFLIFGLG